MRRAQQAGPWLWEVECLATVGWNTACNVSVCWWGLLRAAGCCFSLPVLCSLCYRTEITLKPWFSLAWDSRSQI